MTKLTPHQIYTGVIGGVAVSAFLASLFILARLTLL